MKTNFLFGVFALLLDALTYSPQGIPCDRNESLTDLLKKKEWRNYGHLIVTNHGDDKEYLSDYEFDFKEQMIAISTDVTPPDVLESKSNKFLGYCVKNFVPWPEDIIDIDQRAFLLAYQTQ